MEQTTTVIIGAGQAGLAMSHELRRASVDHVILERGEVANSWRRNRWDSLKLLTPNWQSRLPGDVYEGPEPDGFMTMPEIVQRLTAYAAHGAVPVRTGTEVRSVRSEGDRYRIETDGGPIRARFVVAASGACTMASVPSAASGLPDRIHSATALSYKRPTDLPDGGVLVVGGSATGLQLARELQASGRQVVLSVGEHVRVPRRYRGRDIQWWMDRSGLLDADYRDVDDPVRVRRLPSFQLAAGHETLDLNRIQSEGVEIVGRLSAIRDGVALFSGGLANHCALADLKMHRLLDTIDAFAAARGEDGAGDRPKPTLIPANPRLKLDLTRGEIRSVLWATGYRPDHSWLHLPVFDRKGRLIHDGGVVTGAPGVYVLGLPFLRRRKSTLIDGVGDDARDLADHMLGCPATARAA